MQVCSSASMTDNPTGNTQRSRPVQRVSDQTSRSPTHFAHYAHPASRLCRVSRIPSQSERGCSHPPPTSDAAAGDAWSILSKVSAAINSPDPRHISRFTHSPEVCRVSRIPSQSERGCGHAPLTSYAAAGDVLCEHLSKYQP